MFSMSSSTHDYPAADKMALLWAKGPFAVIEWLPDYTIIDWNPGATRIFGYSKTEAIGKRIDELVIPEHVRSHMTRLTQNILAQVGDVSSINENSTKSGQTIICDWQNVPVVGGSGQISSIFSIAQDITEKVQDHRAVDGFFAQSLDLLATIGLGGYFQKLNPAWSETFGYTDAQLKEYPFMEFVHPEDQAATLAELAKADSGQSTLSFENRYRCQDGSYRWLAWRVRVAIEEKLYYAVARDITTERQTAIELKQQKEFIESVYEGAEFVITAVDVTEDLQLHYVDCNPYGIRISGIPRQSFQGGTPEEIFGPEDGARDRQRYLECIRTGVTQTYEECFTLQGRQTWWLTRTTPLLNAQGRVYRLIVTTYEITDRKTAEIQLQNALATAEYQSNLLTNIVNSSPDWIAVKDRQFRFLVANNTFASALGKTPQDLLGKDDLEIGFTPKMVFGDPDRGIRGFRADDEAALAGQSVYIAAESAVIADGSTIVLETKKVPLRNNQGEIFAVLIIARDVTQRQRYEMALRLYKYALDSAGDAIGIGTNDWQLTYQNSAFSSLYGCATPEEFNQTGGVSACFVNNRDLARITTSLRQGQAWSGELIHKNRRGEQFPVYARGDVITDEHGNLIGIISMSRDISDRKAAEAQQQRQGEIDKVLNRINQQIRSSLDFEQILYVTLQEVRRILNVDRCNFCEYHTEDGYWSIISEARDLALPSQAGRYAPEEVGPIAARVAQLESLKVNETAGVADATLKSFLNALEIGAIIVLPIQAQDGAIYAIACIHQSAHLWQDDEVEILRAVLEQLMIAHNQAQLYAQIQTRASELEATLTELQRTQTRLVQSEKMSSLGQLVAGVAHEINNPVNFIYGNISHIWDYAQSLIELLQLYRKHYPEPAPEIAEQAEDADVEFVLADLPKLLQSMKVGADRIQQIVRSLRNFSRMDESDMKAVDIHEGIDSTLMILQNRLKAKHDRPEIAVVKNFASLPPVECYAGELNQVFMNILSNAIDALEETRQHKGTITITTKLLATGYVQITIGDNGPGIPEQIKSRIFDPFFTTKPVGKGTGMGMSISYQIITEKHQGTITCESVPGQGTNFIVEIPLKQGMT